MRFVENRQKAIAHFDRGIFELCSRVSVFTEKCLRQFLHQKG